MRLQNFSNDVDGQAMALSVIFSSFSVLSEVFGTIVPLLPLQLLSHLFVIAPFI